MSTDNHQNNQELEDEFHQFVTDELYTELVQSIEGQKVVGLAVWEESLADEEGEEIPPARRQIFDMDLYLENHLYLELYATYVFQDPEGDALRGLDRIGTICTKLIETGTWLEEIAVTEDNELVLILSRSHRPQLYLNVGGWTMEEWETLPDEE